MCIWKKTLQAPGIVGAKALRQGCAWYIHIATKGLVWLEQDEWGASLGGEWKEITSKRYLSQIMLGSWAAWLLDFILRRRTSGRFLAGSGYDLVYAQNDPSGSEKQIFRLEAEGQWEGCCIIHVGSKSGSEQNGSIISAGIMSKADDICWWVGQGVWEDERTPRTYGLSSGKNWGKFCEKSRFGCLGEIKGYIPALQNPRCLVVI